MDKTVLIAIPCLKVGGTEMQTLHLVKALTEGGYNCVTVCYFEYDYPMVQRFEEAGSKVVCVSAYGKRPAGNKAVFQFLRDGLRRVVNEYKPDIVHVQYMAPGAMPILIFRWLGIKKIIATLHTDASVYKSLRLIHFLQRHIVTAFTCVSETAERGFFGNSHMYDDTYQLQRRNHLTIHNCLPPKFISERLSKSQVKENLSIGVVARLETIKGTDLIIPAFAKALEKYPECRLIIVGDGKLRPLMEQQQKDSHIASDRIDWHGRVAYNKLPELYKQMDIVWVPSRSEGFGLSAIEAMAQGCVVIASRTGGLTEIVSDGEDGLLFQTTNSDDLALKTLNLLDNPQLRKQIAENAVTKAKQYSFDLYKTRILKLYNTITLKH